MFFTVIKKHVSAHEPKPYTSSPYFHFLFLKKFEDHNKNGTVLKLLDHLISPSASQLFHYVARTSQSATFSLQ
jgi:hypothetical protein